MSVNIMSMVKDAVSQQVMNKIGSMVGLDQSKSKSAFETVAGSILGGLMNKASTPSGAEAVFGAVQKQDTGILDKLGDLLGGGEATDNFQKQGGGVLDMVFGSGNQKAQEAIGSSLGLGSGMVGKLMSMAAPILMGVIGNYVKSKALNAVGLGSLLGEQKSYLGGLLPSGLTSNLGFGNMLSGAGDAASNVASGVGNAAGSVASGVGNAAGSVASGVGNAAGSVGNAAGDAVNAGGGLLSKILPLAILAAILFGLWTFLISPMLGGAGNMVKDGVGAVGDGIGGAVGAVGDGVGAIGGAVGDGVGAVGGAVGQAGSGVKDMMGGMSIPGFDMGGIDVSALGAQKDALMGPIGEISSGFTGLATGGEAAATGLADKLGGFGTTLEGMGIGEMAGPQRAAIGGVLGQFTGMIEGLMGSVPGPLQGIVQPAVDKLMQTISGFGL